MTCVLYVSLLSTQRHPSPFLHTTSDQQLEPGKAWDEAGRPLPSLTLVSFPGSLERKVYTRGEPVIFSHMIMT